MRVLFPFIFIFLMLGIFGGLSRLIEKNFYFSLLPSLSLIHPILIINGFLASVIMLERIVTLNNFSDLKIKFPSIMVLFTLIGTLLIGYNYKSIFTLLGSLIFSLGVLYFLFLLFLIRRISPEKLPFNFMILGSIDLLISSFLLMENLPMGNLGLIMLLLLFPISFILGERVELNKLFIPPSRFNFVFLIYLITILLFLFYYFFPLKSIFILASITFFITMIIMLITEGSLLGFLQRNLTHHLFIAYFWGILGSILLIIYSLNELRLYDAFIHSLSLGFIGTMILAHAPIIALTALGLRKKRNSYLPLILLTLANILRISTDIFLLFLDSELLKILLILSGGLVLVTILAFIMIFLTPLRRY